MYGHLKIIKILLTRETSVKSQVVVLICEDIELDILYLQINRDNTQTVAYKIEYEVVTIMVLF